MSTHLCNTHTITQGRVRGSRIFSIWNRATVEDYKPLLPIRTDVILAIIKLYTIRENGLSFNVDFFSVHSPFFHKCAFISASIIITMCSLMCENHENGGSAYDAWLQYFVAAAAEIQKKNTKSNSNTCKVVIWTIFRYPRLASFFICFCSYPCTWKWKRLKDFIRLSCGHFLPLPQKPCNLARDERGERTKTMQRLDIEYEVCRTEKKAREHIYRFGQQWQMQRWKTQNHNLYPPRFSIKLYVYNTPISLKRLQSG